MISMVVLLKAGTDGLPGLRRYEEQILPILREHGGKLIVAFNPMDTGADAPDEIHVIQFPSEQKLQAYRDDARTLSLSAQRQTAIASTTVYASNQVIEYS